jgi:hypothetical protein
MRINRRYQFLICLLVTACCSSIAHAQGYDSQVRSRVADLAFRTLSGAKIFNLGGIGIVLTITEEEKAFRVLLDTADSNRLFKRLLSEASPEGQIYALFDLYLRDPDAFKSEAERLKLDDGPPERWEGLIYLEKGKIRFGSGCQLGWQERKMLIARMEQGGFDQAFKSTSRTLTY